MGTTIALLTDFGLDDTYVGVMKAVILRIAPDAQLVDLTHAIPPQDVRQAAVALLGSYRYFPPATIFLAVVDPGVGSARRALAVQAGGYRFVAPDNGLLTYALMQLPGWEMVELSEPRFRLSPVSSTFHGRDIFAPAAAYLASGVPLAAFGPPVSDPVVMDLPPLRVDAGRVHGQVMSLDHFGNAITSIGLFEWEGDDALALKPIGEPAASPLITLRASTARIVVGATHLRGIQPTYSAAPLGQPVALVGSSGFLEIAVNQGSAARQLSLRVGDPVEVTTE